jgi:hypothetical protein
MRQLLDRAGQVACVGAEREPGQHDRPGGERHREPGPEQRAAPPRPARPARPGGRAGGPGRPGGVWGLGAERGQRAGLPGQLGRGGRRAQRGQHVGDRLQLILVAARQRAAVQQGVQHRLRAGLVLA